MGEGRGAGQDGGDYAQGGGSIRVHDGGAAADGAKMFATDGVSADDADGRPRAVSMREHVAQASKMALGVAAHDRPGVVDVESRTVAEGAGRVGVQAQAHVHHDEPGHPDEAKIPKNWGGRELDESSPVLPGNS